MLARYIKQKDSLSSIPALRTQGDMLLTDPNKINGVFKNFLMNVYSSDSHLEKRERSEKILTKLGLPTLLEVQVALLDQSITTEEIAEAIKNLSSGKAPGPDGLVAQPTT